MIVRRIGPWSVGRVYGAMLAAMGLIFGGCFALLSLVGVGLASHNDPNIPGWLATALGLGAVIVLPVFYGVMGLVMGALMAALYNLFAGMVGGVDLDVQ
jgi:hypothetical protein